MIRINNMKFEYKKGVPVLSDINLEIYKKDLLGVLGHNGAGKTTLFRILSQLLTPHSGSIDLEVSKRFISYIPEEAGIYTQL